MKIASPGAWLRTASADELRLERWNALNAEPASERLAATVPVTIAQAELWLPEYRGRERALSAADKQELLGSALAFARTRPMYAYFRSCGASDIECVKLTRALSEYDEIDRQTFFATADSLNRPKIEDALRNAKTAHTPQALFDLCAALELHTGQFLADAPDALLNSAKLAEEALVTWVKARTSWVTEGSQKSADADTSFEVQQYLFTENWQELAALRALVVLNPDRARDLGTRYLDALRNGLLANDLLTLAQG